ncbi:TIM44-like domain-containing protein [bacterium]|nr:TIM44-like domain-containing protein [bacterium]
MRAQRLPVLARALVLAAGALLLVALAASVADARVGGGESYGGGGGHSSGGGGGGGGDIGDILYLIYILVRLCFEYPAVGLPLTGLLVVGFFVFSARASQSAGRIDRRYVPTASPRTAAFSATAGPEKLRDADPCFSEPLFLDFVVLLYGRAMEASGKGELRTLRPYLSESALARLERPGGVKGITDVCVGSVSIQALNVRGAAEIGVLLEASFVQERENARVAQYSRERWTLTRRAGVVSKSPEEILRLGCPSCGSAQEQRADGTCPSCDQVVADGRFHWNVSAIQVIERRAPRSDEITSGGGDERGLDFPTVVDTRLEAERRAFEARYPGAFKAFGTTALSTFLALQEAWTKRDSEKARPYETDTIFQSHRFWIERFRKEGVTNVLEGVRVEKIQAVKIARDAYFESITARIWASMVDYKKRDRDGAVIAGDPSKPRSFSEYWTFVRRSGFDPSRGSQDPGTKCPSCGAPVKVSRAGICAYCDTKVTSGSFGWVLARIDQDEVYRG